MKKILLGLTAVFALSVAMPVVAVAKKKAPDAEKKDGADAKDAKAGDAKDAKKKEAKPE